MQPSYTRKTLGAILLLMAFGTAHARAEAAGAAVGVTPASGAAASPSPATATASVAQPAPTGRVGVFGLCGDLAYHTYGMNDVNNNFLDGRNGSFHGGVGYGAALKYGFTDKFAGKFGVDYLNASADSTRTIGGVKYNTRVDLPATMLFLGGEYVLLPTPAMDLKLIAGYTLTSIFNGNETGTNGNNMDMGSISGSTSGAQIGAGLELYLGRGFSFEGDLAYNYARIGRATFAASPSDPASTSADGVVDYSGLMGKVAFTVYLVP